MRLSYPIGMIPSVFRLPEPSLPDCCGACDQARPLHLLEGADGDHVHRCIDCLRETVAGELIERPCEVLALAAGEGDRLRQERDEART
ncbi:hypothetical protein [Blastococcus montanus]|uniref:hypothetical protein n=1 Tax=Blastococcus montanus TaxID=3144973 RepID=UPI0032089084